MCEVYHLCINSDGFVWTPQVYNITTLPMRCNEDELVRFSKLNYLRVPFDKYKIIELEDWKKSKSACVNAPIPEINERLAVAFEFESDSDFGKFIQTHGVKPENLNTHLKNCKIDGSQFILLEDE